MEQLKALRERDWGTIPTNPGVYWWYFPRDCIERFRIDELCRSVDLNLRVSPSGRLCLYHGMAKSLAERIEWHAAQKLSPGALESGFLSTFRFTLLALNDFDYLRGTAEIDAFMDALEVDWRVYATEAEAAAAESQELAGAFHYPLNIQNNRREELAAFTRYLQAKRKAYKDRYLGRTSVSDSRGPLAPAAPAPAETGTAKRDRPVLALISCTKSKAAYACRAEELYRPSTFFRLALEYARRQAPTTFVLSAKHGVVRLDQVLEPYEQTLVGTSRSGRERWAAMVYAQLRATPEYQAAETVLWLAGENYRGELLPRVQADGKECEVPLEGLAQGEQLAWLGNQLGGAQQIARAASPTERPSPPAAAARAGSADTRSAPPRADDFRRALLALKASALATGKRELEISAGELHRSVGGYPGGSHRMPICCSVMRQAIRAGDTIVSEPPKGAGASLRVRYRV